MRTIWKFPLAITDGPQRHFMSAKAVVRRVDQQDGELTMWVETTTHNGDVRWFAVHGTGHEIPDNEEYVGTCQIGQFVWHVFEVKGVF